MVFDTPKGPKVLQYGVCRPKVYNDECLDPPHQVSKLNDAVAVDRMKVRPLLLFNTC